MGRIKLVITDLDGTFLDNEQEPNKRNMEALKACEAAGIPVRAITGRGICMARRVLELGGFEGLCVASNGASIHHLDRNQRLYRKTIPKDQVTRILEIGKAARADGFVVAHDFSVHCTELYNPAWRAKFKRPDTKDWPAHHRFKRVDTDTIEEAIERIGDDAELICMHAPNETEFDGTFYRSIIELGELSLTSSHPGGFDIMAGGVFKSAGAQKLADMMGVKPEEVLACGDHNNDIGMLKWAGIGVAMGDAQSRTKEVADYVSLPHKEGGVAQAIYRYVL